MTPPVLTYPIGGGGVTTRVLECGTGPVSVVFVHGLGARADRWARNLAAVAQAGGHAFAIDLPGHGFAEKRGTFPHGVPGYRDFLEAVLDALPVNRVIIVGTSLGGHVAAALACEYPERVAGLMLVGSTGLFPLGPDARERLAQRAMDCTRAGIEAKLRTVLLNGKEVTESLVTQEWRINNSPGASAVFAALARYFRDRLDDDIVGPRLAELESRPPLELVWGAQDRSVPLTVGQEAARILAPAPLHVIEKAAHAPYFERPDEFNALLTKFIATCSKKLRATRPRTTTQGA